MPSFIYQPVQLSHLSAFQQAYGQLTAEQNQKQKAKPLRKVKPKSFANFIRTVEEQDRKAETAKAVEELKEAAKVKAEVVFAPDDVVPPVRRAPPRSRSVSRRVRNV